MARGNDIKVRCFISIDGAPEVPLESLTPEQREEAGRAMARNMAKAAEEWYNRHPEEWTKYCASHPKEVSA